MGSARRAEPGLRPGEAPSRTSAPPCRGRARGIAPGPTRAPERPSVPGQGSQGSRCPTAPGQGPLPVPLHALNRPLPHCAGAGLPCSCDGHGPLEIGRSPHSASRSVRGAAWRCGPSGRCRPPGGLVLKRPGGRAEARRRASASPLEPVSSRRSTDLGEEGGGGRRGRGAAPGRPYGARRNVNVPLQRERTPLASGPTARPTDPALRITHRAGTMPS